MQNHEETQFRASYLRIRVRAPGVDAAAGGGRGTGPVGGDQALSRNR